MIRWRISFRPKIPIPTQNSAFARIFMFISNGMHQLLSLLKYVHRRLLAKLFIVIAFALHSNCIRWLYILQRKYSEQAKTKTKPKTKRICTIQMKRCLEWIEIYCVIKWMRHALVETIFMNFQQFILIVPSSTFTIIRPDCMFSNVFIFSVQFASMDLWLSFKLHYDDVFV